jgi:Flp pilus assembly protein TadG
MMLNRLLRRDTKGIGAVEFALVAPVLISFVIGIAQMGKLFYANADMKNAMASGARVAGIWPVPTDDVIKAAVNDRISRTRGLSAAQVTLTRGTDGNGNEFVNIKMRYQVPLDFIFFDAGPVTLEDNRKVYTQMIGVMPPPSTTTGSTTSTTSGGTTSTTGGTTSTTGGTTSTTGGTTSTTSGGTTSTTGGTTSTTGGTTSSTGGTTSTTSATSAGGTTSSTSATSASSTGGSTSASSTSASSTTSASSSGSNASSGHSHGNCNKKC